MRNHRCTFVWTNIRTMSAVLTLTFLLGGASAGAVTLDFWLHNPTGPDSVLTWLDEEVIPAFRTENPGLDVQIRVTGGGGAHREQLQVAHAAGVGPDVFVIVAEGGYGFYSQGITERLDPYIEQWGEKDDYVPSAWGVGVFDGETHALPLSMHARPLTIHTRLFEEQGLNPVVPATWEDFEAAARRLSRMGPDGPEQIGYGEASYHEFFLWVHTAGGSLFTPDQRSSALASPEAVDALSFIVDLYHTQTNGLGAQGLTFNNQGLAMRMISMSQLTTRSRVDPELGAQLAVGPPPRNVRHATRVYVPTLAMWSGSPNKDEAWKWLAFLQRPENLLRYNIEVGRLPTRLSTLTSAAYAAVPQYRDIADIIIQHGIPHSYPIGTSTELHSAVNRALDQAYSLEMSPEAALAELEHEWNLQLLRSQE